jgi:hypothetical protein
MKNNFLSITFLLLFVLTPKISQAQFGIELNYGLNGIFQPSINSFSHFGGGVLYDIDDTFGMKLDFGSDKFRTDNPLFTEQTGVNITRISLQGLVNISYLLDDNGSRYSIFNLSAHAGGGYTMVKSSYNAGNDNIANAIIGLTPKIKIADGLYFAVDTSLIFNISQHFNFDGSFTYKGDANSITGIMYNVTGGIIYKFNGDY